MPGGKEKHRFVVRKGATATIRLGDNPRKLGRARLPIAQLARKVRAALDPARGKRVRLRAVSGAPVGVSVVEGEVGGLLSDAALLVNESSVGGEGVEPRQLSRGGGRTRSRVGQSSGRQDVLLN